MKIYSAKRDLEVRNSLGVVKIHAGEQLSGDYLENILGIKPTLRQFDVVAEQEWDEQQQCWLRKEVV